MKKTALIIGFFLLSLISLKAQSRQTTEGTAHWVKIFPNPASNFINIDAAKLTGTYAYFQVYNFMGRKMYETRINSNRSTLYLNDYFRGVYIYQLRDKNGALLETGKFQILK